MTRRARSGNVTEVFVRLGVWESITQLNAFTKPNFASPQRGPFMEGGGSLGPPLLRTDTNNSRIAGLYGEGREEEDLETRARPCISPDTSQGKNTEPV